MVQEVETLDNSDEAADIARDIRDAVVGMVYILAGIFGGVIGSGLLVTTMGIGAPLGAELVIVSVGAIAVGTTMVSRAISNMAGRVVEKGKGELMENCWKS